jgi:hypothetical protein
VNQSSEGTSRRFRGLPAAGLLFLLVGAGLIGAAFLADNSIIAYTGWLILIAGALVVIIGTIARNAEKRGRDDDRKDGG